MHFLTRMGYAAVPPTPHKSRFATAPKIGVCSSTTLATRELQRDLTVAYAERLYITATGPCRPPGAAGFVEHAQFQPTTPAAPVVSVAAPLMQLTPTAHLRARLKSAIDSGQMVVEPDGPGVRIAFAEGLFAPAKATLLAEQRALFVLLGAVLYGLPGDVVIIGHTANRHGNARNARANWTLSLERAKAAKAVLVAIAPTLSRIRTRGQGSAVPRVANTTVVSRQRNRRVEIVWFPPKGLGA